MAQEFFKNEEEHRRPKEENDRPQKKQKISGIFSPPPQQSSTLYQQATDITQQCVRKIFVSKWQPISDHKFELSIDQTKSAKDIVTLLNKKPENIEHRHYAITYDLTKKDWFLCYFSGDNLIVKSIKKFDEKLYQYAFKGKTTPEEINSNTVVAAIKSTIIKCDHNRFVHRLQQFPTTIFLTKITHNGTKQWVYYNSLPNTGLKVTYTKTSTAPSVEYQNISSDTYNAVNNNMISKNLDLLIIKSIHNLTITSNGKNPLNNLFRDNKHLVWKTHLGPNKFNIPDALCIKLCKNSMFSKAEAEAIQTHFQTQYGIEANRCRHTGNKTDYVIVIRIDELKKLAKPVKQDEETLGNDGASTQPRK